MNEPTPLHPLSVGLPNVDLASCPLSHETLKIGKTTFEYRSHSYRLTGFYFGYWSKEGRLMSFVKCKPEQANAFGGSGICGCIAKLSELKILKREIPHDEFLDEEANFYARLDSEESLERLKAKKPNMSERGFKISQGRAFWKDVRNLF